MQIVHAAIYTNALERLKDFYCRELGGTAGEKYENSKKGFSSYFIRFDSGAALELMSLSAGLREIERGVLLTGYAHLAFGVRGKAEVNALTEKLALAGYEVVSAPRTTGDGYYESCILDPDGNRVEITSGKGFSTEFGTSVKN